MASHYQTSPCVHGLWNCACGVPAPLGHQSASGYGSQSRGVVNSPPLMAHWSATTAAGQAQYPPPPPPPPSHQQRSPPAAFSTRGYKANMKDLTCWFWYNQGNCKRSDEDCLYSHKYLGPDKIADKPVLREPGKPAVAGNNALKDSPEYRDWNEIHGRPKTTSSKWENPFVVPYTGELFKERKAEQDDQALVRQESDDTNRLPQPQEQSASDASASHKRSHTEEPTSIIPGSHSMSPSSSQPGKAPRLATDPPSPATETAKPTNPMEAENRALRATVQKMSGIVSSLIHDSVKTRAKGDQHLNAMLSGVFNLPQPDRDKLLPSLAGCTTALTKDLMDAENKARKSMEQVRGRLDSIGHGGLVKGWDREFAHLPMRKPAKD